MKYEPTPQKLEKQPDEIRREGEGGHGVLERNQVSCRRLRCMTPLAVVRFPSMHKFSSQ